MPIPAADEGMPIAAVEQATGIARATLRIWERRYGFPRPARDQRDERLYSAEEIDKLRLIAVLMARGHRPGRLVLLTAAQLSALAGPLGTPGPGDAGRAGIGAEEPVIGLLQRHDGAGVVAHLEQEVRTLGLAGFVTTRLAGLNQLVGACWARGELQVFEEHLYTESVQHVVRTAIARERSGAGEARPRVLLATFPEESHALGLLMVQALLRTLGGQSISLGPKVPVAQIVGAAGAMEVDVVGLSFTASLNPAHVLRGLEQLRGELPPRVAIWAGGSCPVLTRRRIPGVTVVRDIAEVPAMVDEWRETQAEEAA